MDRIKGNNRQCSNKEMRRIRMKMMMHFLISRQYNDIEMLFLMASSKGFHCKSITFSNNITNTNRYFYRYVFVFKVFLDEREFTRILCISYCGSSSRLYIFTLPVIHPFHLVSDEEDPVTGVEDGNNIRHRLERQQTIRLTSALEELPVFP